MLYLEALAAVGVAAVAIYGVVWLLMSASGERRTVRTAERWRAAHYDVGGQTRVVLQKLAPAGSKPLDEHVIATIPVDDPEYDEKFMAAMVTARQRQALFEAEED